ncbi:Kinetochore protein [Trichinella spiralis]|uniref:Kinetochore protein n=1 Tax=Trichinella spiralis TaxID=6334 RepID=A0ABR3KXV8_TRISP
MLAARRTWGMLGNFKAPHISQLLKQGELDFTHSLRSSRPVQYNKDRLNVFIPKVPHESTTELAEHMGYIPDTVARPFTLLKKHNFAFFDEQDAPLTSKCLIFECSIASS